VSLLCSRDNDIVIKDSEPGLCINGLHIRCFVVMAVFGLKDNRVAVNGARNKAANTLAAPTIMYVAAVANCKSGNGTVCSS